MPTEFRARDFRAPAIQVADAGKDIRISAELPGIAKNGLKVSLHDRMVSIEGMRSSKKVQSTKYHRVLYSEFSTDRFVRQVPLPDVIDPKKAKVSFDNGLLEIIAPKRGEKALPKQKK